MKKIGLAMLMMVALLAACSDDKGIGTDLTLPGGGTTAKCRLGEEDKCVTTTVPEATATTSGPGTTAPSVTTAKAAATTTTQAPSISVDIIGPSPYFSPSCAEVPAGRRIRWVNKDSVARTLQSADLPELASGPIPPNGGVFEFKPPKTGRFNYGDERPFAVGILYVGAKPGICSQQT